MKKSGKPKSVKVVTIFCPVCAQKIVRAEFVAHASSHLLNQEGDHGKAI